jgi:hypothetical protein
MSFTLERFRLGLDADVDVAANDYSRTPDDAAPRLSRPKAEDESRAVS